MWPFGKNKQDTGRVNLYVPEKNVKEDRFSKWRKPEQSYLDDVEAKRRQLSLMEFFLKTSNALNILLAIVVFAGIVKLLAFTDYERVVFDDGTYLNCIAEPDGSISVNY